MSTTLYPGIAFSPQTVLADNIGAADTIIPVADVSCFPDGPNLATIGTDETGETVFYAAKTADALSGCQRGVEGEAKNWMAGEPIGRNFTAKDHNDLIDLLGQKQDKLDGKSGQVVGFNAEGKAVPQDPPVPPDVVTVPGGGEIEMAEDLGEGPYTFEYTPDEEGSAVQASQVGYDSTESGLAAETVQGALDRLSAIKVDVGRVSNPNLLHNWYFTDPINQRGQIKYTDDRNSGVYSIDRWEVGWFGTIEVHDGFIRIVGGPQKGSAFNLQQKLEQTKKLNGRIVTASIMYSHSHEGIGFGLWDQFASLPNTNGNTGVVSTTRIYREGETFAIVGTSENATIDIYAVKLELGPVQTLAHKDASGNWVLNDPPPDPALELAKCQRYQFVINPQQLYAKFGIAVSHDIDMVFADVALPVPLRALPAIQVTNVNNIRFIRCGPMEAQIPITNVSLNSIIGNIIYLNIEVHGISLGDYGFMDFSSTDARIVLDANL